jgi:hypothetical protein
MGPFVNLYPPNWIHHQTGPSSFWQHYLAMAMILFAVVANVFQRLGMAIPAISAIMANHHFTKNEVNGLIFSISIGSFFGFASR